jgi:hypothetical protein
MSMSFLHTPSAGVTIGNMAKPRKAKVKLSKEARKAFAEFGRLGGLKGGALGGKATASRRTPEERRAAMERARAARKQSKKAKQGRAPKQAKSAVPTPEPAAPESSSAKEPSSDRWQGLYE